MSDEMYLTTSHCNTDALQYVHHPQASGFRSHFSSNQKFKPKYSIGNRKYNWYRVSIFPTGVRKKSFTISKLQKKNFLVLLKISSF